MLKTLLMSFIIAFTTVCSSQAKDAKVNEEAIGYDVQNVSQIDCQAIVSDFYDGTRKQVTLCFYEVVISSCDQRQVITMWRKRSGEFGFIGNPKPTKSDC